MADLIRIAEQLQAKRIDLVVLDQAIDTSTAAGKLMFHMIGAVAEFERALAEERRNEGIARAKAQGVKFGRPRAIGHTPNPN
jgi:DNA invertase Pin-like site-specific DNA recombinase